METKPEKHVALDVDCNCKAHEGCYCLTSLEESKKPIETSLDPIEDLLVIMDTKCLCQSDPKVADRLNLFVTQFFTKKFRSVRWLKSIFKDKIDCALSGVQFRTKIILPCNPNPNVSFPKTALRKRYSRGK